MTELLTDGSNRGVLFDRFQFTLFKQIVQANPPFSVLQEKVITDYYGIMIHTNSFMFAPTNKKVVQFVESGMAQFLVDKYRYINKFTDDEGPQVLTLDHLDAGFYVWLVCVVFSIFAFIVEIIVHKIKTRHQWIKFVCGPWWRERVPGSAMLLFNFNQPLLLIAQWFPKDSFECSKLIEWEQAYIIKVLPGFASGSEWRIVLH